ncbi:hypothetical protein BH18ACI4_BH18ACI4_20790 [soil metagenome]
MVDDNPSKHSRPAKLRTYPELSRYATDMTAQARQRPTKPLVDNSAAVERALIILSGRKRNPLLIEEASLDTRAIAEGVARRIAAGKVPSGLLNKRLFSLNIDALFAGLKTSSDVDVRLKAVFDEAVTADVILFLDQLYQFAGSRASRSASESLKETLARGDLLVIGATSREAYEQHIAGDVSLSRIFQTVRATENTESIAAVSAELRRT